MLQLMDRMSKYPFGKFVISGGILMFLVYIYVLFCFELIDKKLGVKWAISGGYSLLIIGGLFIVDFNRKYPPMITVPIGILGWVGVAILGYIWNKYLSPLAHM